MKFVGIDLHKSYSHFAVLDQTGRVVTRARIPTQREALVKFFSELGSPARAALEAGRSWYWVYDLVSQLVTELKLVARHRMKVIAESTVKTDKIEARVIAELLRVDYLPTCYVPPDDLFCGRGLKFLKSLDLGGVYQQELEECLRLLEVFTELEKKSSKVIRKLALESEDCRLLMTMPGIGFHNAFLIMAEVGDIHRFSSAEKYASYCGLVPTVGISEKMKRYGHLKPECNTWLRWAYIESAHLAWKRSQRFYALYRRVAERRGKQKAIVAVARKMAVISYIMLKTRTEYMDKLW